MLEVSGDTWITRADGGLRPQNGRICGDPGDVHGEFLVECSELFVAFCDSVTREAF